MLLHHMGAHARTLDSDGGRSSVSSAAAAVTSACAKAASSDNCDKAMTCSVTS